jgi:biopolymer transport protein TolR
MSDINMTPLIDVMLVLLVIFIITAPLMTSSLKLDLPAPTAPGRATRRPSSRWRIDADGRLFLGDQPLSRRPGAQRVREAARGNPATEVQLRADRRVPYGRVAELIGWCRTAGLTRIGFVTEAAAGRSALRRIGG